MATKVYQRLNRAEETVVREGVLRFLFGIATFSFREEGMPRFLRILAFANKNERPFTAQKAISRIVREMADEKLLKLEFGEVKSPNLKHKQGQIVTGVVLTATGQKAMEKLATAPSAPKPAEQKTATSRASRRKSTTHRHSDSAERKRQDAELVLLVRAASPADVGLSSLLKATLADRSSPFFGRCEETVRRAVRRLAERNVLEVGKGKGQYLDVRLKDTSSETKNVKSQNPDLLVPIDAPIGKRPLAHRIKTREELVDLSLELKGNILSTQERLECLDDFIAHYDERVAGMKDLVVEVFVMGMGIEQPSGKIMQ